ncbi:probable L-type lectin-domain containing receptor kinase S.5 [Mangifera indica]|uniref:probable L-type lectin-domain containing receptor kinase S.5 n=1 Tax=Mangifera indica TaxID=29780 RepID=UPI001CFAC377|nr:probable L-type lectin-domain containing receptor kinase S.5 [Mangifera indica]
MGACMLNTIFISLLLSLLFICSPAQPIEFPNFTRDRDSKYFKLEGDRTNIHGEALQLTYDSTNDEDTDKFLNNAGRIMYHRPFRVHNGDDGGEKLASFNSTFVINLFRDPEWEPGHGLAFLIAPNYSLPVSSYGQWLGLTNGTTDGSRENYFVAVEFDTREQEFDPDGNHIGLNINSVNSTRYVSLDDHNITLSPANATSYKVWVEYDGDSKLMQVYMVVIQGQDFYPTKPSEPLLKETINLKDYLKAESYFGFSASTGDPYIQLNCVRAWSLDIDEAPKKEDLKWLIITAGVGVPVVIILLICIGVYMKKRRKTKVEESHELGRLKWLPGMPREFKYKELKKATSNFHESMRLGEGGFGIVYKGIVHEKDHDKSHIEVAVKKFSRDNIKSKGDFLAELAIIHRLRHKHLVRLVGWCHEKGKLLLVYDYMPNGSVDRYLYGTSEQATLNWNRRYKILAGVASALYYLHNECDQKVVHRDLKASNILLDVEYNARLGDFGLARAIDNERNSYADVGLGGVPGTKGYVAPECFHTGKATTESDVYGFGAVVLEVVCGRTPGAMIPDQELSYTLVDWVWMLHREGRILDAVDKQLNNDFVEDEARRALLLGLACSHPIASERPKTEDILQIISGTLPVPDVPPFKPFFTWPSTDPSARISSILTGISLSSRYSNTLNDVSKSQEVTPRLPV